MKDIFRQAGGWIKRQIEWIDFSQKMNNKRIAAEREYRDSNPVTDEKAKDNLRAVIAKLVERGWQIEMTNEFDAILSKKQSFNWILHILILLFLLVIFPLLALFWLFAMVILAVTRKRTTKRVWVEKNGEVLQK